jgi:tetratricopeptide (TPR) repeat protein
MDDRHDFRPWGVTIGAAVLAGAAFFAARGISHDVGAKATPADRMAMRQAAIERAQAQRAAGDLDGAHATLLACAAKDRQACECGVGAAEIEADRAQYDRAWHTANDEFCTSPGRDGLSAEILMGQGRTDDARRAAEHVLHRYPDESHALFAKAWALSVRHASLPEALVAAERAVKGGRGVPALLLLGTIRADTGDNAGAREAILEAAKIAPNDARVAYDLGVVNRAAGDYHGAREAFLHALAIDPKLADARYGLAQLTHSVGADDEARYDAQQFAAIAPGDPRLPELLASLAAKPDAGAAADAGGR